MLFGVGAAWDGMLCSARDMRGMRDMLFGVGAAWDGMLCSARDMRGMRDMLCSARDGMLPTVNAAVGAFERLASQLDCFV